MMQLRPDTIDNCNEFITELILELDRLVAPALNPDFTDPCSILPPNPDTFGVIGSVVYWAITLMFASIIAIAQLIKAVVEEAITGTFPDVPEPGGGQTMLTAGITDTAKDALIELVYLAGVAFLWVAELVFVRLLGMDPVVASADPMFVGSLVAVSVWVTVTLTVMPMFKDVIDHPFSETPTDDPMKREGNAMPERNDNTEAESDRN